jgi:hypothetical protein
MAKYKYTLKFDKKDERDFAFSDLALPQLHGIVKVDLRPFMPPVFDQGELGSCTANALCGLRQYYAMKHNDKTALSRLYCIGTSGNLREPCMKIPERIFGTG